MSETEQAMREHVLLFGPRVFYEDLYAMFRLELPDEAGVPELARDAKVFAAAHERVALARLRCGGNAIRVEVLLLSTGNTDEPADTWILYGWPI